jgi:polyisoprenoid-binding protein YceI
MKFKLSQFRHLGISFGLLIGFVMPASVQAQAKVMTNDTALSFLTYTLRHPLHVVEGKSRQVTCVLQLQADTLGSEIQCSIPMHTFDSGNENRDSHMLELVESLRFPTVEFIGKPIRRDLDQWAIGGEITLHGKSKPVEFSVQVKPSDQMILIRGGFTIRLSDFQIARPSLLLVKTDDTLRIDAHIVGRF